MSKNCKISVIIPSVRSTKMNEECLEAQSFQDFETIIVRPEGKTPKGLFWSFNRDMNGGFKQAKGELIISYQDMIYIRPDTLERFWGHYVHDNKAVIGAVGDQYESFDPPRKVWTDPRKTSAHGSYYPCMFDDIEFTLCSMPTRAVREAGGLDTEFDKYAAISEKELCSRMFHLGYETYLDQSIEYKALRHERLYGREVWDKHYFAGIPYYQKCLKEIMEGTRSIDFLQG